MHNHIYFYIILSLIVYLAAVEFFYSDNKEFPQLGMIAAVFLALLVGLRGDFDSDYPAYVEIFNNVRYDDWPSFQESLNLNVEVLFVLVIVVLKVLAFGPQSIFLFSATLSIGVAWNYCIKKLPYPTLILLGLLSHSLLYREFTQIRHGMSGALCAASLFLISRQQTRQAFLLQFISLFFHSATLFVTFFTLLYMRLSRKNFILFCSLLGATLFALGAHRTIALIAGYIYLPASATIYIDSEYDYSLGLANPTLLKQVVLVSLFFLCGKYMQIKDKLYHDLTAFYFVSVMWLFAIHEFAVFAGRLSSFFGVLEVYLLALLLSYVKERGVRLLFFGLIVIFYCAQFYLNIEYKEIFSGDYVINLW
jgi:hypothetical protein